MEDLNLGAQRPDRKAGDTRGDDTPTVTGPVAAGNGAREATGVSSGNGSSAHGPDVNSRHRHPVSGHNAAPEPAGVDPIAAPDADADAVAGVGVASVFSGVAGLADVSAVLRGLVDELGVVGVGAPRRDILDAALEVEALSRVLGSVQVRLAGLLESEHVASSPRGGSYGWEDEPLRPEYKSTKDLMVNTLHIRGRDAANRLALAEVTAPRVHMDGSPRDAKEPELAKLVAAGEVGIDGAVVIHEAVKSIRSHRSMGSAFEGESSGVDVDEFAVAAEQHLCELASGFGPEFLRRHGR
ncbi:hypothetical protein [Haematomicrobium sanguinis]|uniref:hypothetical protein n=1 Tax=Haematomicrobium sanguinis TaxID=479106 RepID=UPI00047D4B29|nr:hypothetical protein [Haematomicrobium sanguinis]